MNTNLPKSKKIWILFDVDNGHEPSKHYCWWFNTRQNARDHKKWQRLTQKYPATLVGPVETELM